MEERRRAEALESQQKHREELLRDDRLKPTAAKQEEGAPESHEARRSLDPQEEKSDQ
jgi:hypothetical protein